MFIFLLLKDFFKKRENLFVRIFFTKKESSAIARRVFDIDKQAGLFLLQLVSQSLYRSRESWVDHLKMGWVASRGLNKRQQVVAREGLLC